MFNANSDEYTGKPTKARRNVIVVLLLLLASFFVVVAYIYGKAFVNYEQGREIKIDPYSFALYKLGGKWLNIGFSLLVAGYFGYHAIKAAASDKM